MLKSILIKIREFIKIGINTLLTKSDTVSVCYFHCTIGISKVKIFKLVRFLIGKNWFRVNRSCPIIYNFMTPNKNATTVSL